MSLKSDNWIVQQSTAPTHEFVSGSHTHRRLIKPPYTEEEKRAIANWCEIGEMEKIFGNYAKPLSAKDYLAYQPMIEPFYAEPVRYVYRDTGLAAYYKVEEGQPVPDNVRKVISFGTSSYGYDVRLSANPEHIKVFTNVFAPEIDPKRMTENNFASPDIKVDEDGAKYVLIPAHSYLQAPTMEYFRIPRDVMVIVVGKSTYARSGVVCNVTPIEPEFEGHVVIQISNYSDKPLRVYLEEGVASFLFNTITK